MTRALNNATNRFSSAAAFATLGPGDPSALGSMKAFRTLSFAALLVAPWTGCQSPGGDSDGVEPSSGNPSGKADSFEGDDRTRVLESADPRAPEWAASVALLTTRIASDATADVPTLESRFDLCPEERFASDPFLGHCSAFLVAPDVMATAAHCIAQHPCENTQVLFGFNDAERNDDLASFETEDLYQCVHAFVVPEDDIALIRLDRRVEGRAAFEIEASAAGQAVALVGHPLGGRTTVDLSGIIASRGERRLFTTLDTFSGHSGSPVLSLDSGRVVGVHTSGAGHSVKQESLDSCAVLAECRPNAFTDCLAGATDAALLPFEAAGL